MCRMILSLCLFGLAAIILPEFSLAQTEFSTSTSNGSSTPAPLFITEIVDLSIFNFSASESTSTTMAPEMLSTTEGFVTEKIDLSIYNFSASESTSMAPEMVSTTTEGFITEKVEFGIYNWITESPATQIVTSVTPKNPEVRVNQPTPKPTPSFWAQLFNQPRHGDSGYESFQTIFMIGYFTLALIIVGLILCVVIKIDKHEDRTFHRYHPESVFPCRCVSKNRRPVPVAENLEMTEMV